MTKEVTIESIGQGALAEMFADEMAKVVANIMDPNTEPERLRTITMKVKIKPSKDRSICHTEILCESKLAPALGVATQMIVGMEGDKAVASELVQGTLSFDDEQNKVVDEQTGEIIPIAGGEKC